MATFFLDPVGGNDANDGTTFANRWKTIKSGATAVRIAAGDTIKVMGSPAPTSLGQNATWTDGSQTVTLTSAVTQVIDSADSGWSGVTNSTVTHQTAQRKEGTASVQAVIGASFTTGKAAFHATGTINCSAYQQISFWVRQTSGTLATASNLSVKLCTDTIGATAVHTANVPAIPVLNRWFAVTIDTGGALNSAIASVALYLASDQGAQTFQVDHIIVCKAPGSADSLTLTSLIGKNTGNEPWLPIRSIVGTTILLDNAPMGCPTDAGQPLYSGATATTTCYKRETLKVPMMATNGDTTFGSVQQTGNSGAHITFSGGWDQAAMTTQNLDTYLDGGNGQGAAILCSSVSYLDFVGINCVRFSTGISIWGTSNHCTVTAKDMNANRFAGVDIELASASSPSYNTITIDNSSHQGNAFEGAGYGLYTFTVNNNTYTFINLNSNYGNNIFYAQTTASLTSVSFRETVTVTNCRRSSNGDLVYLDGLCNSSLTFAHLDIPFSSDNCLDLFGDVGTNYTTSCKSNIITITGTMTMANAASWGISLQNSSNNTFILTGCTVSGGGSGIILQNISVGNKIIGGTFSSNATADIEVTFGSEIVCIGTTLSSGTPTKFDQNGCGGFIKMQKYGATANDHRQFLGYGSIVSDSSTRHTASGISWKISPTSAEVNSAFPIELHLANIACNANTLVTVTAWVRRDSTSLNIGIKVAGNQLSGVAATSVTTSVAINTWDQLTLTFTPTEAGVIELKGFAYGGTTLNGWIDDITIAQV